MYDDLYHNMRLNELSQRQSDLKGENTGLGYDFRELQRLTTKMALVNQALYELLQSRLGITDEELRLKIREVDKRDGSEDGNLQTKPLKCPKCHGAVTAGALSCPICQATIAPKYPFQP